MLTSHIGATSYRTHSTFGRFALKRRNFEMPDSKTGALMLVRSPFTTFSYIRTWVGQGKRFFVRKWNAGISRFLLVHLCGWCKFIRGAANAGHVNRAAVISCNWWQLFDENNFNIISGQAAQLERSTYTNFHCGSDKRHYFPGQKSSQKSSKKIGEMLSQRIK